MKTVFVLFDTLSRTMLRPYASSPFATPNFTRLARRAVTFDRHYVGSLPCMPARRELQTGRYNFLHRSWGPLEPFDNSVPELLSAAGVYTHLITDHHHYFEDGGSTYHTRYDSFEYIRGQEGDAWKALVEPPLEKFAQLYDGRQYSKVRRNKFLRNMVSRESIRNEHDFPAVQCFDRGLDFLNDNRRADDWFLQIETFSPHEPFVAPQRFREGLPTEWSGPIFDWPSGSRGAYSPAEETELRANYGATLAMCDEQLGRLLDAFDRLDLWKDTVLVVSTDHGFLLGEHEYWGKGGCPYFEEITHIPLFLHHPAMQRPGERRSGLTQTIDLAATMLDVFGLARPREMAGMSLLPLVDADRPFRQAALFGQFAGSINVTDGRYTYHRYTGDDGAKVAFQYTLMPTHMKDRFTVEELAAATLVGPLPFTKGIPVLKVPMIAQSPGRFQYAWRPIKGKTTESFDLATDPLQLEPIRDDIIEERMMGLMRGLMAANDAPPEAFERVGLAPPSP